MIKRAGLIKEWCRKIRKARRKVDLGEAIVAAPSYAGGIILVGGEDEAFFCAGEEVRGGDLVSWERGNELQRKPPELS